MKYEFVTKIFHSKAIWYNLNKKSILVENSKSPNEGTGKGKLNLHIYDVTDNAVTVLMLACLNRKRLQSFNIFYQILI